MTSTVFHGLVGGVIGVIITLAYAWGYWRGRATEARLRKEAAQRAEGYVLAREWIDSGLYPHTRPTLVEKRPGGNLYMDDIPYSRD